jgi:hypothetical protein
MHGTSKGLSEPRKITERENMLKKKNGEIVHDHNNDGIDRRGF